MNATAKAAPAKQVVVLTNEQIDVIAKKYSGQGGISDCYGFARDIAARVMSAHGQLLTEQLVQDAVNVADAEHNEFKEQAARNNGRDSDFAFGSVNSAERIAKGIRLLGHLDSADVVATMEHAALLCDNVGRTLTDAPARALFECAEKIRALKDNEDNLDREELIEQAARICDSSGHHWSGKPALIMFDCAESIRELKIVSDEGVD